MRNDNVDIVRDSTAKSCGADKKRGYWRAIARLPSVVLAIFTISFGALLAGCAGVPESEEQKLARYFTSVEDRWINARFNEDQAALDQLRQEFENFNIESSPAANEAGSYWLALVLITQTVPDFESSFDRNGLVVLDEAIEILESSETHDLEARILLTLAHSLKLQHVNPRELFSTINEQRARVNELLDLDPNNPRLLLVCALSDLNEPAGFGGGEDAANLLFQAAATQQIQESALAPNWGIAEAHARLVQLHIATGQIEQAEAHWLDVVARFGEHPAILSLYRKHQNFFDAISEQ